jgi:DNA-binding transcriptional LysR family regulator
MRYSDPSLSGVAMFVTVARAGTFTQAAAELGITKSAVGKSIARLEERLELKLFHRSTRRVTLTADGEAYFSSCSLAVDEILKAEEALSNNQGEPSGKLRIDMPVAYGRTIVTPILFDLAARHPRFEFSATFNDHLIDPIEEGVDLLIRFGKVPPSSGNLILRRIGTQRQIVCGSPSYLKKYGVPSTPSELTSHHCITVFQRAHQPYWNFSDGASDIDQRIAVPSTYAINDGDSVVEAACHHLGLCQMPEFMVQKHLDAGALIEVLRNFVPSDSEVNALWPKSRTTLPKIRHVVDALIVYSSQCGPSVQR